MSPNLSPADRMARARSALISAQPFFGCLLLSLESRESRDFPTMATDGTRLFWNPDFVSGLAEAEIESVLAHEVLHCALQHHARMGGRDPERWNKACDYAVNRDLVAAGFRLPRGALIDPQFGEAGAEEIYRLLGDKEQNGSKGGAGKPGNDPGKMGSVIAPAPEEAAEQEAKWQVATRQAAAIAKAGGHVPAFAERLLAELNKARTDWRETLRRFIDDATTRDASWMRPNRRFIASGMILPGMVADGVAHIVAIVDTSGSVNAAALSAFQAELSGMLQDGSIARLSVLFADTRVRARQEFEAGDVVKLKPAGGGGTCFREAMAEADKLQPSAVVYFTDLETSDHGQEPGAPVLWAYHGPHASPRRAPPFGDVMPLHVDGARA
jgi:predicted metal-dependent peptidase